MVGSTSHEHGVSAEQLFDEVEEALTKTGMQLSLLVEQMDPIRKEIEQALQDAILNLPVPPDAGKEHLVEIPLERVEGIRRKIRGMSNPQLN